MIFAANLNEQMKFVIPILLLLMLFGDNLSAQTKTLVKNDSIKFKFDQKYIALSPLISPRICFGLLSTNKFEDQRFNETILYVHAFETFDMYRLYGIAFRVNQFFSKNKQSGLFLLGNLGFDYGESTTLFYSDNDKNGYVFLNMAMGLGYSFKLKNDSYIRLEWDIGIKWLLSNIYISYVW